MPLNESMVRNMTPDELISFKDEGPAYLLPRLVELLSEEIAELRDRVEVLEGELEAAEADAVTATNRAEQAEDNARFFMDKLEAASIELGRLER